MKIVYVSHRFETNICATTHLKALRTLYDTDEVFVVDLRTEGEAYRREDWLAFGKMSTKEKILRTIQGNSWYVTNERMDKSVAAIKEIGAEVVFIDESIFGNFVKKVKMACPSVKVISFYHDIAQDLYVYWRKTKGRRFFFEKYAGIRGERITQKYSDVNLVLNSRDRRRFIECFGKSPEGLLPTAVSDPDFSNTVAPEYDFSKLGDLKMLFFVGTLYQPNLDGLDWFVHNVFKEINHKYKLVVVGRGLEKIKDKYKDIENVDMVGRVESIAPFYNRADIVVTPIFDGGGMKQKTAESMAYGKVLVGTTESLQGYEESLALKEGENRLVYCCDTKEEFLNAFKVVEEAGLGSYYSCLTDVFEENYSERAVKRELQKWIIGESV